MRGVIVYKAKILAEDDRRKIISILNGQIGVRDIHMLVMKKGEAILGNHYHWYPEIMYVIKGKAHYWLKNRDTGETCELDMEEGDIMIKTPYITHTAKVTEDCILLDGSSESWIDEEINHVREELVSPEGEVNEENFK